MSYIKLEDYIFDDMLIKYMLDYDTKRVGFNLIPLSMADNITNEEEQNVDSLVQLKFANDLENDLIFVKQGKIEEDDVIRIVTELTNSKGVKVAHYLKWYKETKAIEVKTLLENVSNENIIVEMISSFDIGSLSLFRKKGDNEDLKLYRMRNSCSLEGKLVTDKIESLQLEPSWAYFDLNSEQFEETNSTPLNEFFPFVTIEDTKENVFWGVQLACNSSWQIGTYRHNDELSLSGGLTNREFDHWKREIKKGESFVTPTSIITTCKGNIDNVINRLANTTIMQ